MVKQFTLAMLFANGAFSITASDSNKLPQRTFNETIQNFFIDQCRADLITLGEDSNLGLTKLNLILGILLSDDCPGRERLVDYVLDKIEYMPSAAYVIIKEKFPEHKEALFKNLLKAENPWLRQLALAEDPEFAEYAKTHQLD
jgi:hypothetical protein